MIGKQSVRAVTLIFSTLVLALAPILPVKAVDYPDYRYVALGDSVAAGLGLSGGENTICGRSNEAYPTFIANYYSIYADNVACSGAKIDEGLLGGQERERPGSDVTLNAQIDEAFAAGTPNLITVTVGANDMRWTRGLYDCSRFECGDSRTVDWLAELYLNDLRLELDSLLGEIEERSAGSPPLVALSGYYNPLPATNLACEDTAGITAAESAWLNGKLQALNRAIEEAAARHAGYTRYVPVNFSGHELCSPEPWIQGRDDPAPFHPTAQGQRAIADAFVTVFSAR